MAPAISDTAIANEIQRFISGREGSTGAPINLVVRAAFNPNLKTAWFSAMTQVINQITLLTVILTGAALIREREQGTVEHLLVMPVVPSEIMLAKMIANGLVILVAAMLSLQFVVHLVDRLADRRIAAAVPARGGDLCARRRGARNPARHACDDDGSVRPARHAGADGDATALGQQHADGKHAGLAAIFHSDDQPDAAFRAFAQAVLFRGADITLVWRPLVAMFAIGVVYFAVAMSRFRRVIFGG